MSRGLGDVYKRQDPVEHLELEPLRRDPAALREPLRLLDEAERFAERRGIPPERFEFQMLHGIRRDLLQRLADDGYRTRTYVPYGHEWYPYLTRRLAERPANLWFFAANLLRWRR